MTNKLYKGLDAISNRYEMALLATWREAASNSPSRDYIPFSKEDFVRHGDAIRRLGLTDKPLAVKNVPDIIYTYRARSDLPAEILREGYFAIIGQGKGLYAFARISCPNRIRLPDAIPVERVSDEIPEWVAPFMGHDEQGMLTAVNANNLVGRFLGLAKCFRIQSHLRMGVHEYGQVEVDELYVGEAPSGEQLGIAVEAKDFSDNDLLNISQLFGTSQAVQQVFPNIAQKLLGIKPTEDGQICICEFTVCTNPAELTKAGEWKAYELFRQ